MRPTALFSDIDWLILLGVGSFLLLGKGNGAVLRQLGRYYGRLVRLKNEALGEIADAAGLPTPTSAGPVSVRQYLLSDALATPAARGTGIPAAVAAAPLLVPRPTPEPYYFTTGLAGGTWSAALPSSSTEPREES